MHTTHWLKFKKWKSIIGPLKVSQFHGGGKKQKKTWIWQPCIQQELQEADLTDHGLRVVRDDWQTMLQDLMLLSSLTNIWSCKMCFLYTEYAWSRNRKWSASAHAKAISILCILIAAPWWATIICNIRMFVGAGKSWQKKLRVQNRHTAERAIMVRNSGVENSLTKRIQKCTQWIF